MVAMTPAQPQAVPQLQCRRAGEAARFAPVRSRAEVIRLLDLVCDIDERYEPSSPLPMLLQRARGLVDKNFLEILRDLAPDGLTQAQTSSAPATSDWSHMASKPTAGIARATP